jgi:WD40 repeat protein
MKRLMASLFVIILALLLGGCGSALPFDFDFDFSPAEPVERPPTSTPKPVSTITPAATLVPTQIPTETSTITPFPTLRSPYPVGLGTPMPDAGFPRIAVGNTEAMKAVFEFTDDARQAAVLSYNRQKVLIGSPSGLSLYSLQDGLLAAWPEIKMTDAGCNSCLTVDENISRFAVTVRQDGAWQIKVYDVRSNNQPALFKTFTDDATYRVKTNPVQVALSPDGTLLAYRFGDKSLILHSFTEENDVFEYRGPAIRSLHFSSGGQYLTARRDRDLVFWDIPDPGSGFRAIPVSDPNATVLFSPAGDTAVIASGPRIRAYNLLPLRFVREIFVSPAQNRQLTWELTTGEDESILLGAALYWDARAQTHRAIQGRWNVSTGETLEISEGDTSQSNVFDFFWNLDIPPRRLPTSELDLSNLRDIRFTSTDTLLINSQSAVCILRLTTGEANCQEFEDIPVHASDGPIFREIREERRTLLLNPVGETVYELGPFSVEWVNRTGDFILIDNRGSATNMYTRNRRLPILSAPGVLQSVSENLTHIAFLTRQSNGSMYITLFDKQIGKYVYQKRDILLANALAITADNSVYFLRQTFSGEQATLRTFPAGSSDLQILAEIDLFAPVTDMAISTHDTLAIGMQDGSVIIMALDSLIVEHFQALQTGVTHLAFSPDGRYLTVAGHTGMAVFAVSTR